MSDSREQSYYEIALTNRQVMTIFVVLLVCVLAAFLGGVWVGRGDLTTVATVEPESIDSGRQPGDPPLEELDFFSEPEGGEPAAAERDASAQQGGDSETRQPVILEDIGQPRARQQTTATQPRVQSPPRIQAEPQSEGAAAVQPETSVPTGISPTGEALVVQLISTADEGTARRILEQVRGGGYPVVMTSGDVSGRQMYRVRVGPYASREEAEQVADRIRRAYKLDTWITR